VALSVGFKMLEKFKKLPRERLYTSIIEACENRNREGENVTVRAIRCDIGGGSHSTILKYINLWRSLKKSGLSKMPAYKSDSSPVFEKDNDCEDILKNIYKDDNFLGSETDSEFTLNGNHFIK
jgi:hypothetical protein